MKTISNLLIALFLFSACSSDKKLDRETALKLLKDKNSTSQILDDEIYRSDPEEAKKVLDSGLGYYGSNSASYFGLLVPAITV